MFFPRGDPLISIIKSEFPMYIPATVRFLVAYVNDANATVSSSRLMSDHDKQLYYPLHHGLLCNDQVANKMAQMF
jgi:hypothetical protein